MTDLNDLTLANAQLFPPHSPERLFLWRFECFLARADATLAAGDSKIPGLRAEMIAQEPTLLRNGDPNCAANPGGKPPAAVGEKLKVRKFEVSEADIEPRFVRSACGKRGADVRPDFNWNKLLLSQMGHR
jgi:hypothetical protein